MRFVDVTNDIAFRKIFTGSGSKIILPSFLNAVIYHSEDNKIIDAQAVKPHKFPKLSRGNTTLIDTKATNQNEDIFLVEIQIPTPYFFEKCLHRYTLPDYKSRLDKGVDYSKLKPVYFIGILEFEIGGNPSYFSRHKVMDIETNEQIIRDVEFNFIELPKFTKPLDQLQTPIDQWTYFIKNAENLTVIPESINDEGLREAYTEADKQNWTKLELEDYERASIKEGDEINRTALAVKRAERERDVEIARKLKEAGIEVEVIAKTTGLSQSEIEKF